MSDTDVCRHCGQPIRMISEAWRHTETRAAHCYPESSLWPTSTYAEPKEVF